MYEAIDPFLGRDTWHTGHYNDNEIFMKCLNKIVWNEYFNADKMAEYMRQKLKIDPDGEDQYFIMRIDHYRTKAHAIRDFIQIARLHKPPELPL